MTKRVIPVEKSLIELLNQNLKNNSYKDKINDCLTNEKVQDAYDKLVEEIDNHSGQQDAETTSPNSDKLTPELDCHVFTPEEESEFPEFPNFDDIESSRQREIKYKAHLNKEGYASASTKPFTDESLFFHNLNYKQLKNLIDDIAPNAKNLEERINYCLNQLDDNEESRRTVNHELKPNEEGHFMRTPTEYNKKVIESGKKLPEILKDEKIYEMVNHPNHYNLYDIEAIDMIERIWGKEKAALWCEITAFKYRMRMGTKPGENIQRDLDKEQWYLNKAKELRNKN
jgi:hypothetical protein